MTESATRHPRYYGENNDMYTGDIVIHIDETLSDGQIHQLERDVGDQRGIYSSCVNEKSRHLMVVDFDAEQVRPN